MSQTVLALAVFTSSSAPSCPQSKESSSQLSCDISVEQVHRDRPLGTRPSRYEVVYWRPPSSLHPGLTPREGHSEPPLVLPRALNLIHMLWLSPRVLPCWMWGQMHRRTLGNKCIYHNCLLVLGWGTGDIAFILEGQGEQMVISRTYLWMEKCWPARATPCKPVFLLAADTGAAYFRLGSTCQGL